MMPFKKSLIKKSVNRGKIYPSVSFYSVGSHDTTKKQTGGKRKWQKYFKKQH